MKIQTNVAALNAHRSMGLNSSSAARNMERLSSGFRINSAKDDAAGLAIANKLGADVRSLQQASRNASQATAMLQVADGAAQSIGDILTRMKELATQSNSASIGGERNKLAAEFNDLKTEITRLVNTTQYQGVGLVNGGLGATVDTNVATSTALAGGSVVYNAKLSGAAAGDYTFSNGTAGSIQAAWTDSAGVAQTETVAVGTSGRQDVTFGKAGITLSLEQSYDHTVNTNVLGIIQVDGGTANFQVSSSGSYGTNDLIGISGVNLGLTALGINASVLTDQATTQTALTALDGAINTVNTALGTIGAAMNRIDFAQQNTETLLQNTQAAESVIRDADMAFEMMQFTKNNILQQASQAMLAQANQQPQGILQLLR